MNRKSILLITLGAIAVLLVAFIVVWAVTDLPRLIPAPKATAGSEPFTGTVSSREDLTLTVEPGSVTPTSAAFILHNGTGQDLSGGHSNGARIHVLRDGQWYPMNRRTDKRASTEVPAIAKTYDHTQSPHTLSVNWTEVYGRLEPGHYRLVWNFYFFDPDSGQQRPGFLLSAEFDVK